MNYEVTLSFKVDSPYSEERVGRQTECLFEFGTMRESIADGLDLDEEPSLISVDVRHAAKSKRLGNPA